jgi:AGZA family xanthine/uracil permease-like MFS transporter
VALGVMNLGHYLLNITGLGPWPIVWSEGTMPALAVRAVLPMPVAEWLSWIGDNYAEAAGYLPVAIPLALATVVGGIDCAESAAAAGDDYPTGPIIAAEGLATLVGGLFGGVIQSTPYIGHPAYKAMGARAGYTLATAVFVGGAGVLGYFDWIFFLLPKSVVFPILIFVGLEITAQSFRATPRRHYPALALACVPALAYLASVPLNQAVGESGKAFWEFSKPVQHLLSTITVLSGGFIIVSLLWATALAKMIDGRMPAAAATFTLAGIFSLFGIIHSPLPDGPIVPPSEAIRRLKSAEVRRFDAAIMQTPYHWAAAYGGMAILALGMGHFGRAGVPDGEELGAEAEVGHEKC